MTVQAETEFVDHIESLPPLPAVVQRVLSVSASPHSSAQDVAQALGQDPGVAAKVLRVANSPFYGLNREITQVSRAVVMLGGKAVRNLVLGLCAREALMSAAQQTPEHATLWRHSIAAASACELIARQVGFQPAEEAFVAGLLHDVGQLAMAAFKPELFREVASAYVAGTCRLDLERERFGLDHAEAGFRVLSRWELPESLCTAARCHHHAPELEFQSDADRLTALVLVADVTAHIGGFGLDTPAGDMLRLLNATKSLGLSESDQGRIFANLERRVQEATETLEGVPRGEPGSAAGQPRVPAIWISAAPTGNGSMRRSLLERCGYEVRHASPADFGANFSLDDLIVLDMNADASAAERFAARLAQQGCRRIVLLRDPAAGAPLRDHGATTGVCRLPRLFTAFDLKWAEERLH